MASPNGQSQHDESSPLLENNTPHRNRSQTLRSSPAFIVFVVAISMFTDIFLYSMIVPVLPEILTTRAGVSIEDIWRLENDKTNERAGQYWVTVFLSVEPAVALAVSPVFGYIVDLKRQRSIYYMAGLAVLAGGWTILTFARSLVTYMVGRVLQGVATAMLDVVGIAMVVDAVDTSTLGQMSGYLGAAISLGFSVGPIVGGPLYQAAGYYAIFGLGFVLIIVDLALRLFMVESRTVETIPGNQREGQVSASPSPPKNGRYAIFKMMKEPRMVITLLAVVVQGLITSSFDATLPIFVGSKFGWNAVGAGLIFLPTAVPALGEPLYGWMADRLGVRIMACISFLLLTAPLVCLRFVTHNSVSQKVLLCALLAMISLFVNTSEPACFLEIGLVLENMEEKEPGIFGENGAVGQAFSLETSAYFLGILLGPLWGGFIKDFAGWNVMAWSLGLLAGVTAIFMLGLGEGWGPDDYEEESRIADAE